MAAKSHVSLNVWHEYKPGEPSLGSSKGECQWQISTDPGSGSQDELYMCGRRVVWYNGLNPSSRMVKVSYTMDTAVLQALWCQFEEETKNREASEDDEAHTLRGVCVREKECLTLFLHTGAVHYVTLPFQVHHVWSLHSGLLIERSVPSDGGFEGLPTLFTLLHPSDDLCPVTCRRQAEGNNSCMIFLESRVLAEQQQL